MIRFSITGTAAMRLDAVALDQRERAARGRSGGAARPCSRAPAPSIELPVAVRVEERGRDQVRPSRPGAGPAAGTARAGRAPPGRASRAPFGVPVVPEVRITVRPSSAGGSGGSRRSPWLDQLLEARQQRVALGGLAHHELRRSVVRACVAHDLVEVLVVDQHRRLLALITAASSPARRRC